MKQETQTQSRPNGEWCDSAVAEWELAQAVEWVRRRIAAGSEDERRWLPGRRVEGGAR